MEIFQTVVKTAFVAVSVFFISFLIKGSCIFNQNIFSTQAFMHFLHSSFYAFMWFAISSGIKSNSMKLA